tara:strand:- start:1978 stop:2589 length:612 start_codon:yes stop_codon:yes gene_type:complete
MKRQNKFFYEKLRKETIVNNKTKEDNWVSIPIENALDIQEKLFDLWLMFEKTSAVLGTYGHLKDNDWQNIKIDPIDYRITLFILRKSLQEFRFMSLKEIEKELLDVGVEQEERRLRDRIQTLIEAKILVEYDIDFLKKKEKLKSYIEDNFNLKTKLLYGFNLEIAQQLLDGWENQEQKDLNVANSTDLQSVLLKCGFILKQGK